MAAAEVDVAIVVSTNGFEVANSFQSSVTLANKIKPTGRSVVRYRRGRLWLRLRPAAYFGRWALLNDHAIIGKGDFG